MALTILLTGGCGRKGNPVPPSRSEPAAIEDLHAENRTDGIVLTWTIPQFDAQGKQLQSQLRFRILRAVKVASCGACPEEWTRVAEVQANSQGIIHQQNGRLKLLDSDISDGTEYVYRIISLTESGEMSKPSNTAGIRREK